MAGTPLLYLDHNATTALHPAALAAMTQAYAEAGNPSSVHAAGRAARRRVDAARRAVAAAVGLPPRGELVFTGGGTEAIHLAVLGSGRHRILLSAVEHDATRAAAALAGSRGAAVEVLPVDAAGRVRLDALEERLAAAAEPALVSVMAANNETGAIQPVAEIARLAHAAGALFHCDAVQALGKIPFDMAALGADYASLSAHKLGGPQGVGALAVAPGIALEAQIGGGGQERGFRAGTENVAGIAGFGAAARAAVAALDDYAALADLRDRLEAALLDLDSGAASFGGGGPRLPNTLSIAMPGVPSQTQIMAFDLAGIAVSAGSACSSGKVRASHVLGAMGVPEALASCAIRISLGRGSDAAGIERMAEAWAGLRQRTSGAH